MRVGGARGAKAISEKGNSAKGVVKADDTGVVIGREDDLWCFVTDPRQCKMGLGLIISVIHIYKMGEMLD